MPAKPRLTGKASAAWIMRPMCHGPGVQVVAKVPCAGPVPPPSIVVTPDISASSICCGQMKWMWRVEAAGGEDLALAGDDLGAGADDDGDARLDVGIAGLADRGDAPSFRPISALTMPQWSRISALVMTVSTAPCLLVIWRLAHAVADHLAAAEFHLLAIDGEILLDLDDEVGVGQPHAVAGGRAEHVGIDAARDSRSSRPSSSFPITSAAEAVDRRGCRRARPASTVARLARLEAHRGAGGDVEPHAARLLAVELQRRIGFEEMIVRADLDRPVAGVGDLSVTVLRPTLSSISPSLMNIRRDHGQLSMLRPWPRRHHDSQREAGLDEPPRQIASCSRIGSCTVTSLVPSGNVASTWMSWIISAMPSITCARVMTCAPRFHQLGDGAAVARAFEDEIGDQRDRFRMVELDAALQPAARHHRGHGDQQLVFFARREIHRGPQSDQFNQSRGSAARRARRAPRIRSWRSAAPSVRAEARTAIPFQAETPTSPANVSSSVAHRRARSRLVARRDQHRRERNRRRRPTARLAPACRAIAPSSRSGLGEDQPAAAPDAPAVDAARPARTASPIAGAAEHHAPRPAAASAVRGKIDVDAARRAAPGRTGWSPAAARRARAPARDVEPHVDFARPAPSER